MGEGGCRLTGTTCSLLQAVIIGFIALCSEVIEGLLHTEKTETLQCHNILFGGACDEVAWNQHSQKHLCQGRLEGRAARMLIDTGCVSAEWVDPSKMNLDERVPVLCVHRDTMEYPTAAVKLQVREMVPMPVVPRPFQRIAMDLIGPLPRTWNGNRFILTIRDYATQKPSLYPIQRPVAVNMGTRVPIFTAFTAWNGSVAVNMGTRVPIFTAFTAWNGGVAVNMGTRVPIFTALMGVLPWIWGPGSPYPQHYQNVVRKLQKKNSIIETIQHTLP